MVMTPRDMPTRISTSVSTDLLPKDFSLLLFNNFSSCLNSFLIYLFLWCVHLCYCISGSPHVVGSGSEVFVGGSFYIKVPSPNEKVKMQNLMA